MREVYNGLAQALKTAGYSKLPLTSLNASELLLLNANVRALQFPV
jgi:hypothetical protein